MNREIIETFQCPRCLGNSLAVASETPGDRIEEGEIACPGCGGKYPVERGIADFAPEIGRRDNSHQRRYYSASVFLYELWRRAPWFRYFSGTTWQEEVDILDHLCPVQTGENILDVGCGTGLFAREFARSVGPGQVLGLDRSWPMMLQGIRYSQREGLENLSFVRRDATALPFCDASLDRVNCCGAVHLFPQIDTFFQEVARVLRPGAPFTCLTYLSEESQGLVARWVQRWARRTGIDFFSESDLEDRLKAAGLTGFQREVINITIVFKVHKP